MVVREFVGRGLLTLFSVGAFIVLFSALRDGDWTRFAVAAAVIVVVYVILVIVGLRVRRRRESDGT